MRRHAGVLGLSACILSSPYDVPTWMPQLLMDLSAHLNDTQPIEVHARTHTPNMVTNTRTHAHTNTTMMITNPHAHTNTTMMITNINTTHP